MIDEISIHALLAESDEAGSFAAGTVRQFLSTLSLRRATPAGPGSWRVFYHFYPRSPCGERPVQEWEAQETQKISIHALLAESDPRFDSSSSNSSSFLSTLSLRRATHRPHALLPRNGISIHALLAESDPGARCPAPSILFLSTLSLRRATCQVIPPKL